MEVKLIVIWEYDIRCSIDFVYVGYQKERDKDFFFKKKKKEKEEKRKLIVTYQH